MSPKVKAWMESIGWRWSQGGYWVKDGLPVIPQDLAAEMHRQYLQGKIEELRHVESRGLSGAYYWYNDGEYREIPISNRIAQLEAELKELEEEK